MKYYIALACMFFMASFTFAQNANEVFQFIDKNGNVVPDGSVVTITEGDEDLWGDIIYPTGLSVKNNYEEDLNIRVDYNVTSLPNGSFQICFPMSCMYVDAVGAYKTSSGVIKAGEIKDIQAEWIPTANGYGTCIVELQLVLTKGLGSKGPKVTVKLDYKAETASNNIDFADANVKAICVANWDTNHDGELSEAEAAAVTNISGGEFQNKNITSFNELQYFTGLKAINYASFLNCSSLASIVIPENVTSIDDRAFCDCSNLSSLTLGKSLANIGNYSFQGCSKLPYVSIPKSVRTIGIDAFSDCSGVTAVNITDLSSWLQIDFDWDEDYGGTPNPLRYAHHLYINGTLLAGNVIIPEGTTGIHCYAFDGCTDMTAITIPSSIRSIGQDAFRECDNLSAVYVDDLSAWCKISFGDNPLIKAKHLYVNNVEIENMVIPNDIETIGEKTFFCYNALKSVEISNSVKSIGDYAFAYCDNLESVIIPNSVSRMGKCVFLNCYNLTSITIDNEIPPYIESNTFYDVCSHVTLYVPAGSKAAYEAADYWKEFKEIVEMEAKKFTLDISDDGGTDLSQSHLYDRDGNEYDYIASGNNEFDEGSYIRISPFIPAALYIQEIIVNGESVGTWTEDNAPTEYVIENLSENTTVEFKTYLRAQWRTLSCTAEGPGKVEMYRNGNYVGVTSSDNPYDTHINLVTEVFEEGDVLKLVFVADEGSRLTSFLGGEYPEYEDIDFMGDIKDNTYSITFNSGDIVNNYGYLVRSFKAIFEGPTPSTNNALSASVPTLLTGKTSTMSLSLTNEDVVIACEFDLQLPNGITLAKDDDGDVIRTLGSRASKHVLEVSDRGNGVYHFLCYSNTNKVFTGNDGELLSVEFVCDESMSEGTYEATVKNIILSDPDLKKLTLSDYTFGVEVIDADPGDVNNDGDINVMDVVQTVAYIMGNGTADFIFGAADMDNDGSINVVDLVRIVSMIMSSSTTAPAQPWTDNSLLLNTCADGTIAVGVNTDIPYVASEFIVEVGSGQSLEDVTTDKQHRATFVPVDDTHYKVMTYSSSNQQFADTDAMLTLHVSGEGLVTVRNAMLVDEDYKGVTFAPTSGGYTTGIMQMENGKLIIENSSVYDLQGRRHDTLQPFKHEVLIVNGKKKVGK